MHAEGFDVFLTLYHHYMVDHIVTGVTYKKLPMTTTEVKRTRSLKKKRTYRQGTGDKVLDGGTR